MALAIDMGDPAGDQTTLTFARPELWWEGAPIRLRDQTNRERTVVVAVLSLTTVQIKTFIRPSRGFARHNRRVKQARRTSR